MPKPKLLSISPIAALDMQPYAGAAYYAEHIAALRSAYDITIVCPESSDMPIENFDTLTYRQFLSDPAIGPLARLRDLVYNFYKVLTPGLETTKKIVRLLENGSEKFDLIEVQWPEYQGLLPIVRKLFPETPIVSVIHDVYSQRVARNAQTNELTMTALRSRLLPRFYVERTEGNLLNNADHIIAFSQKDTLLLRRQKVTTKITTLNPPIEERDVEYPNAYSAPLGPPIVLFVGAFDRAPNVDAATWLVEEIWPRIKNSCPNARLCLAGVNPPETLLSLAQRSRDIEATGYVTDLGAHYASSRVVVAPLRLGAGLKFKVATAMFWRRPVVLTSVAVEGYTDDPAVVGQVCDDAGPFADEVIRVLQDESYARDRARAGAQFATNRFGRRQFVERLIRTYEEVLATKERGQ